MIWYANIDVSANGNPSTSGNGTEDFPLSWDSLLQLLDINRGVIGPGGQISAISDFDTIKIRGYYFQPSDVIFVPQELNQFSANGVTFQAWDLEEYGFWKVRSDYGSVYLFPNHEYGWERSVSANIEGFVVENAGIGNNANLYTDSDFFLIFRNGIFLGDTTLRISNTYNPFKFLGCTFANGTFFASDSYYGSQIDHIGLSAVFEDCVFTGMNFELSQIGVSDQFLLSGDYIFSNCTFTDTSATIFSNRYDTLKFEECTFGWEPTKAFPLMVEINTENKNNLNYLDFGLDYNLFSGRRKKWITNDYNFGAYGKSRKGSGAFYFNDDIYVDFNAITTGTGTYSSPFDFNQFKNYSNSYDSTMTVEPKTSGIVGEDCFYIKGDFETDIFNFVHTDVGGLSGSNTYYLKSWNPSVNGPFRIKGTNEINLGEEYLLSHLNKINIDGGILYSPVINVNFKLSANTTFFKCDDYFISNHNISMNFNGCTIITSSDFDVSTILNIKDSIFIGKLSADFENASPFVINSVLSVSSDSELNGENVTTFSIGNQYNWIQPVWPVYNDPISAFAYSNLGQGILISGSGDWNV